MMTSMKVERGEEKNQSSNEALFALGDLFATIGAIVSLPEREASAAVRRHARGDWGIVCAEDRARNDAAVRNGGRLVSAYLSEKLVRFYVITEADRSVTTVCLADEN